MTPKRNGTAAGRAATSILAVVAATAIAACAGAPAPQQALTATDSAAARRVAQATLPAGRIQAVFRWQLQEQSSRFEGKGSLRLQGPDHARLDLFGPRGETVLAAALVGDEIRVPPGVRPEIVPPAPLLWSVLGVVRPPADARLIAFAPDSGGGVLTYRTDDGGTYRYTVQAGHLQSARWQPSGGGRHTVELEPEPGAPLPGRADYRDYIAFRELVLNLEDVTDVASFPPEIWTPGR